MSDLILVSIIVPIYNTDQYLEKCLDSITNQTYKDIEIICIDDGSSDSSPTILKQYADSDDRITIITKENEGVAKARNIGIKAAKGDYIAFIDSDDYVSLDYIEYLVTGIQTKDADISICGYYETYDNKKICHQYKEMIVNDKWIIKEIIRDVDFKNYLWHKLIKKSLMPIGVFPENLTCYCDVASLYKIFLNSKKIYIMPEPKYHYHYHPNSLSYCPKLHTAIEYCIAAQNRFAELSVIYPEFNDIQFIKYLRILNITIMSHIQDNCSYEDYDNFEKNVRPFINANIDELKRNKNEIPNEIIDIIIQCPIKDWPLIMKTIDQKNKEIKILKNQIDINTQTLHNTEKRNNELETNSTKAFINFIRTIILKIKR